MKVCMIAPEPPPYGGIANWLNNVIKYIEKSNGIELNIINIAPSKRSTEGRNLWNRIVDSGFEMVRHLFELKKILTYDMPDVFHMTTSGQLALIRDIRILKMIKRKNVPAIYHLHFGRVPEIKQKNNIEWRLLKKAMSLSDYVVAIDNSTYDALMNEPVIKNVINIPNPFDMSNCLQIVKKPKKKQIVFVGWVIKSKGIEELLSAWQNLQKDFPLHCLKIVGPSKKEYKESLIKTYGAESVCFYGEKSHQETLQIIQESSLFVLPSYTEGFPNVVLEAMALETPIIATNVGAIPTMLEGCGRIVLPQNVKELEGAIREAISDVVTEQFVQLAKDRVASQYSLDIVCGTYAKLWEKARIKA